MSIGTNQYEFQNRQCNFHMLQLGHESESDTPNTLIESFSHSSEEDSASSDLSDETSSSEDSSIEYTPLERPNYCMQMQLTDEGCTQFLNELSENPKRGFSVTRLWINPDSTGNAKEPNGRFTDTDLKNIIKLCPNLEELALHNCFNITAKSLKKIANLTFLKFLSLPNCNVTDEALINLRDKPFVKLNLYKCDKITSTSFDVISTLKNLIELVIANCKELKDEDLQKFINLNHLVSLNISGCKKVTDAARQTLANMKNLKLLLQD